jgi:hypothetical protein
LRRESGWFDFEASRSLQQSAQGRGVAARGSDDHPPVVLDFGPTWAAERLREDHGLDLGVETLRQWMIGAGRLAAVNPASVDAATAIAPAGHESTIPTSH